MISKKNRGLGILTLLLLLGLAHLSLADEIVFQDQKASQIGTVVTEDEQSVTIKFSRDSISSITRTQEGISTTPPAKIIWEERGDYFVLKIPRQDMQIEKFEAHTRAIPDKPKPSPNSPVPAVENTVPPVKKSSAPEPAIVSQTLESSQNVTAHQQLLQEEMGGVQGVIIWQGKPMENGKVRITLETYTGFSISALRQMLTGGKEKSTEQEVSFETQTDSQGRYAFSKVPPGYYRLYWLPDPQTGWVHRLREKADFEVISGKVFVQNIPEKKK